MKETQCNKILEHIKKFGSINPLQAKNLYHCMRLASRINDLKKRGHPIISERGKGQNEDGETVHFAVYRLQNGSDV